MQVYRALFVRFYALMACIAIGLGIAFFVGGEVRFSGHGFVGAHDLVAWLPIPAYLSWAALFLIYGLGLVAALGKKDLAIHLLRFGVVIYLFLVTSFVRSAMLDPVAALSGIVIYTATAVAHLFLSDHLTQLGWGGG